MSPGLPRTQGTFRRHTRRPIRSVITLLTAVVLGVGGLTACSSAGGSEDNPAELTYLDSLPFNNLYPPTAGFYPNGGVVNNITDRLLWQDPDTLELHPWIATDLPEVNEDATEFTFHLRDGVTYSDGTPLDAENVVKNFDLFGLGNTDNKLTASEQISSYERGEVIDDSTVRFHFSEPEPGFPQAASSINAGLLANASLEMTDEGFAPGSARKVIGSGPFVITGEKRNRELTLSAREDYDWAPPVFAERGLNTGRPELDTVRVVVAKEDSVRVGGLKAGQADIARQIEAPEEKHLAKAGINIHAAPTNGVNNGLAFRFRHPLLQDIRVRQAIIAGVDREKILRTLFSDSYPLATSTLARTAQGYEEQKGAYEFNPDKARALLDEAGWTVGHDGIRTKDGKRLRLVVNDAPQQPRTREVVTMLQQQLRAVGIDAQLHPGDVAAQKAAQTDENQVQLNLTMVGRADYDVIKSQYYSDNRNALLNMHPDESIGDEKLQQLLLDVAQSPTEAERAEASKAVQKHLTDNAYVLPFFEEPQVFGVHPHVHGFRAESIGRPWFYLTRKEAQP
ncbi:TIGR04028 family ABC transporter substrate-binding protein [Corynebacterium urealyticum]|uniref:ABC transport system, substrate-binding domain n=1 Tax=Corynebacterium urealyticum (strain ATCC 43042 / DSM 7109) TaxID=504474 RepID=B1VEM2_CORU7|nr:TIGR04028 family ABC transporter substrate-binding protein [Corynebacterium urealyticum]QQC42260.1 TIGR04028 family ABC transporter substrate-binding protein [Corynebacterium urealyticum]CAQ04211.1 ABC transport system, substrate-binding domain [Corynebacterium urealyticum DSM 7109]SNV94077.1 ABC transporter substrate-binding protein [Corynebacterium urealyticum]